MSNWQEQAKHFLENETQFHLGMLPTEQAHVKTRGLSDLLQEDVEAGVRMLQSVDDDVTEAAIRVFASPKCADLVQTLAATFKAGGRVCFSGCGATGRLSILLEACWRHFWQDAATRFPDSAAQCQTLGDQVRSIMTGGDFALIRSVENFEDYMSFGRRQVCEAGLGPGDVLVAISEGGETSSVIGTIWEAHERGARTFFAFNNPADILAAHVERSRDVIECPEVVILDLTSGSMGVAGSTRMQATTSELLVIGAALDLALAAVLPEPLAGGEAGRPNLRRPHDYAVEFSNLLADLGEPRVVAAMAEWIRLELSLYERNGLITYFADECLLDIFTDTTERAPTFMLPPFRKCDDSISPPSWAFVKSPVWSTDEAWKRVLGRTPRCLDWDRALYSELGAPEKVQEHPPALDSNEIRKFTIGCEDDPSRLGTPANAAVLAVLGSELSGETGGRSGVAAAFPTAARPFAERVAVVVGGEAPVLDSVDRTFHLPCRAPATRLRLWERLAVKLAFNTVSTATMGCMGRLTSNWMACVETTNKKLIDRGSRLIAELAGVDYETACYALHETNDELRKAARQGDAAPSPVALTIERLRKRA